LESGARGRKLPGVKRESSTAEAEEALAGRLSGGGGEDDREAGFDFADGFL